MARTRSTILSLFVFLLALFAVITVASFIMMIPATMKLRQTTSRIRAADLLFKVADEAYKGIEKGRTDTEMKQQWGEIEPQIKKLYDPSAQADAPEYQRSKADIEDAGTGIRQALAKISKNVDRATVDSAKGDVMPHLRVLKDRASRITNEASTLTAGMTDSYTSLALLIVFLCLLTGLIAALTLFLTLRSRSMETIRTREITMREGEPAKAAASTNGHGQPERINALIEASPLAAVEWDSDLRLTRFSGQAERMFGIPASQAIGRKWSELGFVHPEDQNSVIQAINPLVSGQVDRIVVHNKNRRVTDGKTLHCVWYSSAVPSPDGQGRHFLSLAQDVTDQRAAEDAYRREADFVHRVAENSPIAIVVYGLDEKIRFVNNTALEMFGLTRDDITNGRADLSRFTIEDATDGKTLAHEDRPSVRALRYGEVSRDRLLKATAPWLKEPVYVSATSIPLKGKDGNIEAALLVQQDVTKRFHDDREREHLQHELAGARRLETVGNLATGIAHDFGNSLLAIDGSADALASAARAGRPIDEPHGQLKHAISSTRDLIQSLVGYAAGRDGQKTAIDLNQFVPQNAKLVSRLLPPTFRVETDPASQPVTVNASRTDLQRVLINLAVNARDAMPDGGTLRLGIRPDEHSSPKVAVLKFSDNGPGMTEAVRKRLFERFFTTKAPGRGTGVGLSSVHAIVQEHGGTIDVESSPGNGTTFIIRLPLVEQQASSQVLPPPLPMPPATPPQGLLPPTLPPPATGPVSGKPGQSLAIMVVQHDDRVRPLVVQTLRNSGHAVESFVDGESAYEVFRSDPSRWHLVVVDLNLPGLDGVSVLRRLRRVSANIPAIAIADEDSGENENISDSLTHVLQKPFTMSTLKSAIAALVS